MPAVVRAARLTMKRGAVTTQEAAVEDDRSAGPQIGTVGVRGRRKYTLEAGLRAGKVRFVLFNPQVAPFSNTAGLSGSRNYICTWGRWGGGSDKWICMFICCVHVSSTVGSPVHEYF